MATVLNLNQYLTQGAMEGFTDLIVPVTKFSYVVKPGACALNDVVRVPFAQNTSASYDFAYATGYATEGNVVAGKSVTLSSLKYQKINLSDSDLALLNPEAIMRIGRQAGSRLAADVISASFAGTISQANFATGLNYSGSAFTSSVAPWVSLDKLANDAKWPNEGRVVIAGTTLYSNILSNTTLSPAYAYGNPALVQNALVPMLYGFEVLKSTYVPNNWTGMSDLGFAANADALLFGNGYHSPQDGGSQYIAVDQVTDAKSGITIGFRQYYDPAKATSVRVFDCLFGSAVGNTGALIHITG